MTQQVISDIILQFLERNLSRDDLRQADRLPTGEKGRTQVCRVDTVLVVVKQEPVPKDNSSSTETSSTDWGEVLALYFVFSLFYIVVGMTIASAIPFAHIYDNVVLGWFRGFFAPVVVVLKPLVGDSAVSIYDSTKNGSWYDLGFVVGLLTLGWAMIWTKNRLLEA